VVYKHPAPTELDGPGIEEWMSNAGCTIVKDDLNAEDAEVFAKGRREMLSFAYLCENLGVLCV
jgi:hypothetical protein